MSFRQRLLDAAVALFGESRSSLENPQTPLSFPAEWLLDIFNGGRTDSGIRVSEMTALQVGAVLSCVNIISGGLAALPLHVMERVIKDHRIAKKIALNHALYEILFTQPNVEMTSFTFKKTLQTHALLWGNAYAEIERNNANEIIGIWPRNPARTRPVRTTQEIEVEGDVLPPGTLIYQTSDNLHGAQVMAEDNPGDKLGTHRIILAEDMIHIPGLSLDGRLGQSTVYLARQIIGLALATEKFGAKFFGNGAVPGGVLTLAGKLEERALENLRRSFSEAYGGENRWKTAILEQGVTYTKIGANPNEGQFLETRRYQRIEIASIFNVPPHMIGEIEKTKSSVEQSSIEFVLYTLGPWISAWENELKRKLFPSVGRNSGKYFPKFDTRRLLYPDADARSKFYQSGKQWGYLNSNDIRELEDMNPIEDGSGDKYWMPFNMVVTDAEHILNPPPPSGGGQGQKPNKEEKQPQKEQVKEDQAARILARSSASFTPIFRDALGRFLHRSNRDATIAIRILGPVIACISEALAADNVPIVDNVEAFTTEYLGKEFLTRSADWRAEDLDVIARVETSQVLAGLLELRAVDRALYIMRHGTTEFNEQDRYREWTDADLDAKGREIVKQAAELLKDKGIRRIFATNLQRGKTTAEIVSNALGGIPIEYTEALNTWRHGYGGKTKAEAGDKVKYFIEHPDETPPNGESLNDFRRRNQKFLDGLQKQNSYTGPNLIITSGSNIASWNTPIDKIAEVLSGQAALGPGGFGEMKPDGSISVVFAGDVSTQHKPS